MIRTKFNRNTKVSTYNKHTKANGPKRVFTVDMLEAVKDLASIGAGNKELSYFFNVSLSTIEYWIANYPIFANAFKIGKVKAILSAGKGLHNKAIGCSIVVENVVPNIVKEYYPDGKIKHSHTEHTIVKTNKQLAPDAYAAYKYLNVMFREVWAENTSINHNLSINGTISHRTIKELPLQDLNEQQKELIFSLNMKQLADDIQN